MEEKTRSADSDCFSTIPSAPPTLDRAHTSLSASPSSHSLRTKTHETLSRIYQVGPDGEVSDQIGRIINGRFELLQCLGGGGMGQVFKAMDQRAKEAHDKNPYVALKVLNREFRDHWLILQREAAKAKILANQYIIKVFDFDRDDKTDDFFMTMEYLDGCPLNKFIKQEGGISFKRAWPIIKAIATGLDYAHKQKIVHSDIKPGNIILLENDDVRIIDFGIARAIHDREKGKFDTVFDALRDLGALTPAYASFEMWEHQHEPDAADDLYALGCVAYEMLTGKHPYEGMSAPDALKAIKQGKKFSLTSIPGLKRSHLRGLKRILAIKREDRTSSAAQFIADMEPYPMPPLLWTLSFLGISTIGIGAMYFYKAHSLPTDNTLCGTGYALTEEKKRKVEDLLDIAETHFDVGYLTSPSGSNALWAYQEVLRIDPCNTDAPKGMQKIADALEQSGWDAFERGNRVESLKFVAEGLQAVPQHEGLIQLRRKLSR